jgi:glycosyltransferase involved in cell wall biosynthesis
MPKLLWANLYCLLDRTSGASMAVRQQLLALQQLGFEVAVLGTTVFDHERGAVALGEMWPNIEAARGKFVTVEDGPLRHDLLVTESTARDRVLAGEERAWYGRYITTLERYDPDIVYYYGGHPFDFLIAEEARQRGIATAFYVANEHYHLNRGFRDVDLLLTDSVATAELYRQRQSVDLRTIGAFIDPGAVVAPEHRRERILFVNPTLRKGGGYVARLAIIMEQRRPDIVFEVIESRGDWQTVLEFAFKAHKEPPRALSNVVLTPSLADMRPAYGRARLLLAPSLGRESAGRVIVEAMMNGVPPIVADHAGPPEMVQEGGIKLQLPSGMYQAPYNRLPPDENLTPVIEQIERLHDDEEAYRALSRLALDVARREHRIEVNAGRLASALTTLLGESKRDARAANPPG